MAEMVIDRAGKVSVDREMDTIRIDGVQCSMELLPHCVNPDPTKYYRAVRNGETITVVIFDRAGVLADLSLSKTETLVASQEQLDALGHGIAYDAACTVIESNCVAVDGIQPVWPRYFDVSKDGIDLEAEEHVAEMVKYLDMRGLLDRHPDNSDWVTLRDESEAS